MTIKKILINMYVIAVAFGVFIFWYSSCIKATVHTTVSKDQNYKVYLITNRKDSVYWQTINQGASDMSKLLGLTYVWEAPKTVNVNQQIEVLNNAVDNGADAVLISVLDANLLSEPIRQAKSKGLKIIYISSPSTEEGVITLATNNYQAGKIAGTTMLEELEMKGYQKGEIGIVSLIATDPSVNQREIGFTEIIKGDGRFTLLDTVYAEGNPEHSQEVTAKLINEHPDLVGLLGTGEATSEGMGNAIKTDHNRIVGIAFDKTELNMKLLSVESLKAVIAQNPYTMGFLGISEAYAALRGFDTGPKFLDTGVSVIRKK